MKTNHRLIVLALIGALMVAGCGSTAEVGELRTQSHSVELDDAQAIRVEINMGAGDLEVRGDAEKLLEADFIDNITVRMLLSHTSGLANFSTLNSIENRVSLACAYLRETQAEPREAVGLDRAGAARIR